MSVKFRLVLSYIGMLVIPIAMTAFTVTIMSSFYISNIKDSYNIKVEKGEFLKNPFKEIKASTNEFYQEIRVDALKNPEKFEDVKFLDRFNSNLVKINSYLVVRKNNDLIYIGNKNNLATIIKELPSFAAYKEDINGNILIGNEPLLIKQQDFYFKDNSEASVFLVTDGSVLIPSIKKAAIKITILSIIMIIATNGLLTFFMSRSILLPLKQLEKGANEIKSGNLDFNISIESRDEIGEVCNAFEEMRTQLKESLNVQNQYEEDRKELISNISHDLKTPITTIKGYVEGIIDGVADNPEKLNKYLKTIYNKATHMDNLIDELFLFSKLDLNKLEFHFSKVNINSYLRDCVDELSFELEKKNVEIVLQDNCKSPIFVTADIEKLNRVILNIIGNSAKYMNKQKGIIKIELKDNYENVIIIIGDNGKGIASKDIPYIFDRFYREDSSRNSFKSGSGLGLSIAKKIIETHKGSIWAESQEDKGTIISFTLMKYESEKIDGENIDN